jgi:hypothetical protein
VTQVEVKQLIARLRRDAVLLARRFELEIRALDAERTNVRRRYGVCYSDGSIRIRLQHASTGRPLRYSSLVNTLCHELAHLRHFNHGPRFRHFYLQILEFARREGIYRPAPTAVLRTQANASETALAARMPALRRDFTAARRIANPEQLELFVTGRESD